MSKQATPSMLYLERLKSGDTKDDARQREALVALDTLHVELSKKRVLKRKNHKGVYLWGEVGRGKSMLMDLFFDNLPISRKRRVHFHAFMQHVHQRLHHFRSKKQGDPVSLLVREIADAVDVLCFDEMQATDVADASLLFRLFEGLFNAHVTIVATSNRPPEKIYQGGVQAERFEKFIGLLKEKMQVCSLMGEVDYRRISQHAGTQRLMTPLGNAADVCVAQLLTTPLTPRTLSIHGRTLTLHASGDTLVASFAELCEQPLGAGDYLAIASQFPTIILRNVPVLSEEKRNEAKRFVTLIDALYEAGTSLYMTAAAPPDALYPHGHGSFEFKRTASRLIEMLR